MGLRPRGMAALAATITAAGVAAADQPDQARGTAIAVQDDVISSGPVEEIAPRLRLLERSRTKVTRFDVLWWTVAPERPRDPLDPRSPEYDWSRVDAIARGLGARGITPIVTIYSAPAWATGGRDDSGGSEVNPALPSPSEYARFVAAFATRYSGSFRPSPDEQPLPAIRHLEVWNEPNLGAFLGPQVRGGRRVAISRYKSMLRSTYRLAKRANPRAVVIAGVGGPRSSTGSSGTGALDWMRAIVRGNVPFDAYSQHVYPAAAPLRPTRAFPAWSTIGRALDELDRVPRHRGKPLYITEAGYTTKATPRRRVRVGERAQARYLSQIASLPVVSSSRIPVVVWFNLQDNPEWPAGLVRGSGGAKPSWQVFRRLAANSSVPPGLRPGAARRSRVRLSLRQLRINQRVFQAAVRRVNAIEAALRTLDGDDLRPGGLRAAAFGPSVTLSGTPRGDGRAMGRSISVPGAARTGARFRLSRGQLLVNQRIAQAAVLRANALERRLGSGLTGGDVRDGTITSDRIAGGLRVVAAVAPGRRVPATRTVVRPRATSSPGAVALTARQLLVNQRVGQAAVRRANRLRARLEAGLTTEDFRPGSLSSADLAAGLRTAAGG